MNKNKRKKANVEFLGPVITAGNRGKFLNRYRQDYITDIENKGNPEGLNDAELAILAKQYANFMVKKEKKHLKAFLKGQKFYKVYGRKYPVMTGELLKQQAQLDLKGKDEEE